MNFHHFGFPRRRRGNCRPRPGRVIRDLDNGAPPPRSMKSGCRIRRWANRTRLVRVRSYTGEGEAARLIVFASFLMSIVEERLDWQ
jgi:hypothetical protein